MSLKFTKPAKANTPEQNAAMEKAITEHQEFKDKASTLPPLPEAPKTPAITFKKKYNAPAGRRRKTKRSTRKGRKAHRK